MGKMKDLDIERMNEDLEPTEEELQSIELENTSENNWRLVACIACGKDVDLLEAEFIDEAPYHKHCAREEKRLRYEERNY